MELELDERIVLELRELYKSLLFLSHVSRKSGEVLRF